MTVATQHPDLNRPDMVTFFPAYADESFSLLSFKWHLGSAYIAANARSRGFEISHFVSPHPLTLDDAVTELCSGDPPIIGATCYDVNYYFVAMLCREIRRRRPDTLLVVGGPSATFSDEYILGADNGIDVCVRGEGEEASLELIEAVRSGGDLTDIAGISYRARTSVVRNPDRPLLTNGTRGAELDAAPSPYLTSILPPTANLGILTSRGCVFHCTYCNFSSMSRWRVRYHSVDRVIDELKALAPTLEPGQAIPIQDDTFTLDINRSKEICTRLIDEDLDLRLWCETRADRVDRELLELMRKAGVETIHFGVESADPGNLHTVKKLSAGSGSLVKERRFIEQIETHVASARELGVGVTMSIIVGLPDQNREEAETTIDFVKRLRPDYYYHNDLVVYPGTELARTATDFGLGIEPSWVGLPHRTRHAFDVASVPVLPFAIHNMTILESTCDRVLDLLAFNRAPAASGVGALIVTGKGSCAPLISEARHRIALGAVLLRIGGGNELQELVEAGTPVVTLVTLQSEEDDGHGLYVESAIHARRSRPRRPVARIRVVDFAAIDEARADDAERGWRTIAMLRAETERDLEKLRAAFDDPSGIAALRTRLDAEVLLCSQCRWHDHVCPAFEGAPEVHDLQVGAAPCSNVVWAENCDAAPWLDRDELEARRGCATCPARDRCSRCQRLGAMPESEYCRLQIENAAAPLLETITSLNDMNRYARQWLFSADSEA